MVDSKSQPYVLEHCQEGRLVSDICDVAVVQEVQAIYKGLGTTNGGDEGSHVSRYEELVLWDCQRQELYVKRWRRP